MKKLLLPPIVRRFIITTMNSSFRFNARTRTGAGRGKDMGTPTINMRLEDVPAEMEHGIYACWAHVDGRWIAGALHYGPRPVFKDSVSCEVYLLDVTIESLPERIDIQTVGYIRPVMDFPSSAELVARIQDDVAQTRAMLAAHGSPHA